MKATVKNKIDSKLKFCRSAEAFQYLQLAKLERYGYERLSISVQKIFLPDYPEMFSKQQNIHN